MLAADPNALVIVAARCAPEPNKRLPSITRLPSGGIRDINHVRIVGRNRDSHCAGTAPADAAIAVDQAPGFSGVVRAVDSRSLFCFHRSVNAMRLGWRNCNADATESAVVRRRQTLG